MPWNYNIKSRKKRKLAKYAVDPLSSGPLQLLKKCSLYTDSDFFKQKIITKKNLSFYNAMSFWQDRQRQCTLIEKNHPFWKLPPPQHAVFQSPLLPNCDTVYDIKQETNTTH